MLDERGRGVEHDLHGAADQVGHRGPAGLAQLRDGVGGAGELAQQQRGVRADHGRDDHGCRGYPYPALRPGRAPPAPEAGRP